DRLEWLSTSACSSHDVSRMRADKTELALHAAGRSRPAGGMRVRCGSPDTWGLARTQAAYRATGTSPSAIDLHRDLNVLKKTDLPWLSQVSMCAPQEAWAGQFPPDRA